jgi:sulfate transport system substrate-binding protein
MKQKMDSLPRKAIWYLQLGLILLVVLILTLIFFGGETVLGLKPAPVRLLVYALSTHEEVLTQAILPRFEQAWESESGQDLEIRTVFDPSGTLAGQINLGAPADFALFSNVRHVKWLKFGGMIDNETQPGIIGYSPMVIVTRQGNPHNITRYEDLQQPGLQLLHADPRSSGAGEWSLLAEYGSSWLESNDPQVAEEGLMKIWENVRLLGPSARVSLILFELGACDALITYEQDARLAQERGVPLEIVVPPDTIVAEHVAVIVDKNVTHSERPVVEAFMDYLLSSEGQQIFERYHLRPVIHSEQSFPGSTHFYTVEDLGGWDLVYTGMLEPLWQREIEPHLDLDSSPSLMQPGE